MNNKEAVVMVKTHEPQVGLPTLTILVGVALSPKSSVKGMMQTARNKAVKEALAKALRLGSNNRHL